MKVISLLLFLKKKKVSLLWEMLQELFGALMTVLGGLSLCDCIQSCSWSKNSKQKCIRKTVVKIGTAEI